MEIKKFTMDTVTETEVHKSIFTSIRDQGPTIANLPSFTMKHSETLYLWLFVTKTNVTFVLVMSIVY